MRENRNGVVVINHMTGRRQGHGIGAMMLLSASLIWGVAFVAQSAGMEYVGPYTFTAVRSALAALVAAKRAGENQFYWSLGAGFAVFLILLIVAVLPLGQSIHFVRTVISLLCSLIASALGGYAGANMRKKKRYSHIKK